MLTVGGFNIPAVDVDDITIHHKDFKGVVNHIRCRPASAMLCILPGFLTCWHCQAASTLLHTYKFSGLLLLVIVVHGRKPVASAVCSV